MPALHCYGIGHDSINTLHGKSNGGSVSAQYLFNVIRTSAVCQCLDFPKSLSKLRQLDSSLHDYIQSTAATYKESGSCLYECGTASLRSAWCSRQCEPGLEALVGHGACSACVALFLDATVKQRANCASNQADATPSRYTNHQYLKAPQAIDRLASVRDTVVRLFREKEKEKRKATALKRKSCDWKPRYRLV